MSWARSAKLTDNQKGHITAQLLLSTKLQRLAQSDKPSTDLTKLVTDSQILRMKFSDTVEHGNTTCDLTTELAGIRDLILRKLGEPAWEYCHHKTSLLQTDKLQSDTVLSVNEQLFELYVEMLSIHEPSNRRDVKTCVIDRARGQAGRPIEQFLADLRKRALVFHATDRGPRERGETGISWTQDDLRVLEWEAACRVQANQLAFEQMHRSRFPLLHNPDFVNDPSYNSRLQSELEREKSDSVLAEMRSFNLNIERTAFRVWRWVAFRLFRLLPCLEATEHEIHRAFPDIHASKMVRVFRPAPPLSQQQQTFLGDIRNAVKERLKAWLRGFRVDEQFKRRMRAFISPFICGAGAFVEGMRERNREVFRDDGEYLAKLHFARVSPDQSQQAIDQLRISTMDNVKKIASDFKSDWIGNSELDKTGLCTLFAFCYILQRCATIPFFVYDECLSGLENRQKAGFFCGPWHFPQCFEAITQARSSYKATMFMPRPRLVCFAGESFVVCLGETIPAKPLFEDPLDVCTTWCIMYHVYCDDRNDDYTYNVTIKKKLWSEDVFDEKKSRDI